MKSFSEKRNIEKEEQPAGRYGRGDTPIKCADIQRLLFDYLSHELSESQSVLVREHIRKCAACRAESAEIESTLEFLHKSDISDGTVRLSDERRKRILLAVFHPVINWIDLHHKLVSMILALAVLISVIYGLRNFKIFRHPKLDDAIPVWILFGKDLPKQAKPHYSASPTNTIVE